MGLADVFGDGFLGEIASSITATQAVTITSVQAETPDDATSPPETKASTGEVTARATVADAATTLSGIRMSRGREKERERPMRIRRRKCTACITNLLFEFV